MVKMLAEAAPAKINLFLRVIGRRSDGYHELDSLFVPVSVEDQVRIEVRPSQTQAISLKCAVASIADPKMNLAARAAHAFMREFDVTDEVRIELDKTIPMGAGLGGGSSDAGAVLRMMAALFSVDSRERLEALAVSLGADVPFFLDPRPARVGGIGEIIAPFEKFPTLHLVIAVPPVEVPTGAIFKALQPEHWSGPAPQEEVDAILAGRISASSVVNDLASVAIERFPEIGRLRTMLGEVGARAAAMTGSGGAVFGVFDDARAASKAAESLRSRAPDAKIFAVHSLA
jgi:4-diphosphocytidyl-2-C-methyl-D-erythritol kinase